MIRIPRLIDAKALKEKILSLTGMFDDGGFYVGMDAVLGMIDFQKTIDPESIRPHGRWERSDIQHEKFTCSVCGGASWYYDFEGLVVRSRYCPNCGAKMDLEEQSGQD